MVGRRRTLETANRCVRNWLGDRVDAEGASDLGMHQLTWRVTRHRTPSRSGRVRGPLQLAVLFVVLFSASACSGSAPASRESTQISAACDAAFTNNETQLPGGKSSELLDAAISACGSVADWQGAWSKHANAHGSALDPIQYLTGRCVDFPNTVLCRSLTAVPAVTISSALDPPQSSTIEGMPIPQSALVEASTDPGILNYRVPGATFDELRAWYERELPEAKAFGPWTWCEKFVSSEYSQKTYAKTGTSQILAVTVVAGTPPAVIVSSDESGPC